MQEYDAGDCGISQIVNALLCFIDGWKATTIFFELRMCGFYTP